MRRWLSLLLLLAVALPVWAQKKVNVQRLEEFLATASSIPDPKLAHQLSGFQLTERWSTARLVRWKTSMPGQESEHALTAIADASSFLPPAAAEMLTDVAPDAEGQRKLLDLATKYAQQALTQLPNFFATRRVALFLDKAASQSGQFFFPAEPLTFYEASSDTVYYRNAGEQRDSGDVAAKLTRDYAGLAASGNFGPVLKTVLTDAGAGKVTFVRWEKGNAAPVAVFRYSVPRGQSHYNVRVDMPWLKENLYKGLPAYHGEIAFDSVTGAMHRLTLMADLKAGEALTKSDLMVEYGPVEIGGKTYDCPVRSVTMVTAPMPIETSHLAGMDYQAVAHQTGNNDKAPLQSMLSDVAFVSYHVFRSDARIVTESGETISAPPDTP